jgi:hypothetical protein
MCVCESGCVFITFDDSWQKRVTNKLQNVKEDEDGIGEHMRLPRETNWLQAALKVRQPTRSLNHIPVARSFY